MNIGEKSLIDSIKTRKLKYFGDVNLHSALERTVMEGMEGSAKTAQSEVGH